MSTQQTAPSKPKALDARWVDTLLRYVGRAHVALYRRTGGRVGKNLRIGAGFRKPAPVLLLDHVGRRSGTSYTTPLLFLRDGEDVVIVASQGGRARDPQWYRNLRAHPETTVQIGPEVLPVRARTASAEEKRRLWPRLVETYADFDTYQAWADRDIPVVICTPR